jgi:transposase
LEVGFLLAKYGFKFKKKVIEAYQRGEGGYSYLAEKYGVKNRRQVLNWVHYYEEFGDEGLMRSRKNDSYTFEYKLHVIELYLSSEVSYQELALSEGISNNALIAKWVNDFRIAGPDALRPKKKGRKKSLDSSNKKKDITLSEAALVDTSAERVKQLEDELLKLRIENAYLKELRRLRLEEKALLKKQRESSTASEESSN